MCCAVCIPVPGTLEGHLIHGVWNSLHGPLTLERLIEAMNCRASLERQLFGLNCLRRGLSVHVQLQPCAVGSALGTAGA